MSPRSPRTARSSRRLADLSQPIARDRQLVQKRRVRVPLALIALGIVAAMAAAVFVLPVRDWWRQGEDLEQRRTELALLDDVNQRLEAEIERLQTPAGIAEAARTELGLVEPGEQRLSMVNRGQLPSQLPPGWPYSVVTGILAARNNVVELAPVPTLPER